MAKRRKRKKRQLVNLKRFTRQELKRVADQAHERWIKENTKYYTSTCFKPGTWVRFREAFPKGDDYRQRLADRWRSVRMNPDGEFITGRVSFGYIQKTGRISRYTIKYLDLKTGYHTETTRGIKQVEEAIQQDIDVINMICELKGYPKLTILADEFVGPALTKRRKYGSR